MTVKTDIPFDPKKSLVYLTQKTFVFNTDGKFLTLLRTATAPTRPLKWDLPGGAYEIGESLTGGAEREILEESGLKVSNIRPIATVGGYDNNQDWWVTIVYRAEAESVEVSLSYEHQEYRWVTKEEFLSLDSSDKWRSIAQTYIE